MGKRNILIPLDGSERSMHSLDCLKKLFKKDEVKVTLMNVTEIVIVNGMIIADQVDKAEEESQAILSEAESQLQGYEVDKYSDFGYAADEILKKAKKDSFDAIIMTKSTKKGLARMIGSVTAKVVKNAKTLVIISPE